MGPVGCKLNTSASLMSDIDYWNRFRWAACQLDALGKCRNRLALRNSLKTLPPTLDATYDRILCAINEEDSEYAVRILRWLAFSSRPLLLEEVSEVVAIDTNRDPMFDQDEVLEDPSDVLDICSSLITITTTNNIDRDFPRPSHFGYVPSGKVVGLAHYSVKEYLVSDRSRPHRAEKYRIQDVSCNGFLAISCLGYLFQFDECDLFSCKDIEGSKLAQYAAEFWSKHAQAAGERRGDLSHQIMSLFLKKNGAYLNWAKMSDLDRHWRKPIFTETLEDVPTPLYFASFFGWTDIIEQLLSAGANINAQGGLYGNALQAASAKGHKKTVGLLLTAGANINLQGGFYGNALQAALANGHEKTGELLLTTGADVNAQGGRLGNALQAASAEGQEMAIGLLLTAGANVNAQGGLFGNALQAASARGHEKTIELLLTAGANINEQGGEFGNALQAASGGGRLKIVRLLLTVGANINAQGGELGSALQLASAGGDKEIVELLLNKGASVNAQGGEYNNALQAASGRGHEKIVELLLTVGANVNAQGGYYGNALQAASARGHLEIVEFLLSEGADVNAQGGEYNSALQAALRCDHNEIAELLRSKGAIEDI
jgi:ankyrin repeat protein